MNIQAKVAMDKQKHPEKFCPKSKCLWRTGGGYCPRHRKETNEPVLHTVTEGGTTLATKV